MTEPVPRNNEFGAAEEALRKAGSNLWFGGLSKEWQDFLIYNTVECFDNYEVNMLEAATWILDIYKKMVSADPGILQSNPWNTNMAMPK